LNHSLERGIKKNARFTKNGDKAVRSESLTLSIKKNFSQQIGMGTYITKLRLMENTILLDFSVENDTSKVPLLN
jgi:hypothetical protein